MNKAMHHEPERTPWQVKQTLANLRAALANAAPGSLAARTYVAAIERNERTLTAIRRRP